MDFQTVLIVDDEEEVCAQLALYFSRKQFRVSTALDGFEALDLFKLHDPAVVITDYAMPGMTGIELLEEIKKTNPRTQVIFISGHADMKVAVQAIKEEAFDFLAKPFEPADLLERVQQAIARARQFEYEHDTYKGKALTHERYDAPDQVSVLYCKVALDELQKQRIVLEITKFLEQGTLADRVILSLAGVDHINNVGLNLLVDTVRDLEATGRKVVLTQIPPPVFEYLKTLGYNEYFKIASTMDLAMAMIH